MHNVRIVPHHNADWDTGREGNRRRSGSWESIIIKTHPCPFFEAQQGAAELGFEVVFGVQVLFVGQRLLFDGLLWVVERNTGLGWTLVWRRLWRGNTGAGGREGAAAHGANAGGAAGGRWLAGTGAVLGVGRERKEQEAAQACCDDSIERR